MRRNPFARPQRSALGEFPPRGDGGYGNRQWPYGEEETWGDTTAGAQVVLPPPDVGQIGSRQAAALRGRGLAMPFALSDRGWANPTTFAQVPINAATNIQAPVLSQNYLRNFLLIQNNSTATAPDTAPIFYIGFNSQPQVGFALGIAPGASGTAAGSAIFLDIICPRDSIYVLFGPSSNANGTQVIQGTVIQGTYSPGF